VQLANRAVTEVRRRMTVTHRGRRGRASDPEWQQHNRLTRSAARMRAEHVDRLADTFENLPTKIGAPILAAWNAKEDLLDLLALARTRPDRETPPGCYIAPTPAALPLTCPNCTGSPAPS
jgi:transposase